MQIMEAPLFIVWRESVEALLVIAILYNWLRREKLTHYTNRLWYGTGLGLLIAAILAGIFWLASNWYGGAGGEWMFTIMMAVAALLILQMVVWMHRNGKHMKSRLEEQAQKSLAKSQGWGLMLITTLAVAREGSETVVFLSGIGAQQVGDSLAYFILGAVIGLGLALLSFWLLQKFANAISWRYFFFISEIALLLIGGGLFVSAFDKASGQLADYNIPDWFYNFMANPIWNSSHILQDNSTLTGLTGYHASPSLMQISALALFWVSAILFCSYSNRENYKD